MLRYIHVKPLAAESLGVRSMCTYVETPEVRILLDAGVSLAPIRYGLPPHPREYQAIAEARKRIADAAEKAEVVTLSHYHFDHHTPSFEDWLNNWTQRNETTKQIYNGKTVLIKNPKEKINYSQRRRAWMFQQTSGKYAEKLETAEGKCFAYGKDTVIRFSEPVSHGPENSALGWILMTTVEYQDEKFMFAPDVQGPMSTHTLEMILKEKPQLLMIGGPPLYLSFLKVDERQVQAGLKNLEKIVEAISTVIVEHHVLRDENWREKTVNLQYASYKAGSNILTAAEFLGTENSFLEASRKKLFAKNPPSKEFEKWMRSNLETRKRVKPLI